jgi:hypothetical protein
MLMGSMPGTALCFDRYLVNAQHFAGINTLPLARVAVTANAEIMGPPAQ